MCKPLCGSNVSNQAVIVLILYFIIMCAVLISLSTDICIKYDNHSTAHYIWPSIFIELSNQYKSRSGNRASCGSTINLKSHKEVILNCNFVTAILRFLNGILCIYKCFLNQRTLNNKNTTNIQFIIKIPYYITIHVLCECNTNVILNVWSSRYWYIHQSNHPNRVDVTQVLVSLLPSYELMTLGDLFCALTQ